MTPAGGGIDARDSRYSLLTPDTTNPARVGVGAATVRLCARGVPAPGPACSQRRASGCVQTHTVTNEVRDD